MEWNGMEWSGMEWNGMEWTVINEPATTTTTTIYITVGGRNFAGKGKGLYI